MWVQAKCKEQLILKNMFEILPKLNLSVSDSFFLCLFSVLVLDLEDIIVVKYLGQQYIFVHYSTSI